MRKLILPTVAVASIAVAFVLFWALPKWNQARALDDGVVAVKNGNYARAIELLTPLSDAGSREARDTLGLLYAYGWGVTRDRERAANLFATAGVSALPERFFSVGKELEEGKIVPKDRAEALAWFKLAAAAGHPQAKARLASIGDTSEKPR
jgi:TPR repeat protein